MQDIDAFQLTAAAAYGTLAFLYARFAQGPWRLSWRIVGRSAASLTTLVAAAAATHFAACVVMSLVPGNLWHEMPPWLVAVCVVAEWGVIWAAAGYRHAVRLLGGRDRAPGHAWLAVNYGPAVLISGLAVTFPLVLPGTPAERLERYFAIRYVAVVLWLLLGALGLPRPLRPGGWRPGFAGAKMGRLDFALSAGGVLLLVIVAPIVMWGGGRWHELVIIHVGATLLILLPALGRALGDLAHAIALGGGTVLVVVGTLFGARLATRPLAAQGLDRLADVLLVMMFVAVALFARTGLQAATDRLVLGRRLRRWDRLQVIVRTLPAEDGVVACCQRLIDALVAEHAVDGAAILLGDAVAVSAGDVAVEPIRALWPWGPGSPSPSPGALLPRPGEELPPPVVDALAAARVVAMVEVASPRRCWGCLCLGAGRRFTVFSADEERQAASLGAQLALVLDAAALVERAVGVERALAQAEKLAAVGETAARIAHEIRNPVTAARSLAQLLAHRPTSLRSAEQAALILAELERVERQVAALLSFSRREDFRFEPVALDELVRSTLAGLRPRLEEASVTVGLDLPGAVVARGDREKLRQVLVNLVQNAIDAMADCPAPRQIAVVVALANGTASLCVSDTGGGIPPELLPHVFEPFRSGKPQGTGLGLAIAKQTIDGHGGRIAVTPAPGRGTVVTVELPAMEGAA